MFCIIYYYSVFISINGVWLQVIHDVVSRLGTPVKGDRGIEVGEG